MGKTTYANAFDLFNATEEKTAKIETLGGLEIKYRELTMFETDGFAKRLIKDYGSDGSTPTIDFDEASEIKYEKMALAMIEPAVTVDELKKKPTSFGVVVNEIVALIDGREEEDELDEKGN